MAWLPVGSRPTGLIKGQQTAILAMGKLGSREMTASSDLDLILLYDFDHENPDSDGGGRCTALNILPASPSG